MGVCLQTGFAGHTVKKNMATYPRQRQKLLNQCHAEGGATKGGVSKCDASKRRQTQTNASKRRGENASKRKQTRANVAPPFIAVSYTPLCKSLLKEQLLEIYFERLGNFETSVREGLFPVSVAAPAEPCGEKIISFVQILGSEKFLYKFLEKCR